MTLPLSHHHDDDETTSNKKEELFILNVCENMCLAKNLAYLSIKHFRKIRALTTPKKYAAKDVASYAIYATVEKHVRSSMMREIVTYTGTSAKKLKRIDDNVQHAYTATASSKTTRITSHHCNNPTPMVNKYCLKLGLDYTAIKAIETFVHYWHDKCASQSLCLIASAIYIYCKRHEMDLSLNTIAKTCWVSKPSIYRFTKKYLSASPSSSSFIKEEKEGGKRI